MTARKTRPAGWTPADPHPSVQGYCPACGWATLFVGAGGHVTCSNVGCPNPTAVDELLRDRETAHVVTFTEEGFTIRHPLLERLGDALLTCDLHEKCAALNGPPVAPGRYRAVRASHGGYWWSSVLPDPEPTQ